MQGPRGQKLRAHQVSSLVLLSRPWKYGLAACVALILLEAALLAVIRPNECELVRLRLQESLRSYDAAGFYRRQFFDEGRNAHAYTVFVPHRMETTARPPVILFLNGFGENGTDGVMPLTNGLGRAVWETQRHFPFVCVFPQLHPGEDWSPHGLTAQRALAILKKTEDEYGTDPDRVYLTGLSTGATGAWSLAAEYPERFAAVVPVSGVFRSADTARIAKAGLPVWAFCNGEDSPELVRSNRALHEQLLQSGLSPHSTEIGGTKVSQRDFHDSWNYAFRNGALYSWLLRQEKASGNQRDRFVRLAAEILPADSGSESVIVPCRVDGDFELHAEFRPGDSYVGGFGLWGPTAVCGDGPDVFCSLSSCDYEVGGISGPNTAGNASAHDADLALGSVVAHAWNDLRIQRNGNQLTVRVNGWELYDVALAGSVPSQVHLALVSAVAGSSPVEWRNLRGRGDLATPETAVVEELVPFIGHTGPRTEAPSVALETIVTHWQQNQEAAVGKRLIWAVVRDRDHLWSPFQAMLQPELRSTTECQTEILADSVTVTAPWCSPFAECSQQGLDHGLTMHNYNQFRSLLRDSRSPDFTSGTYHLAVRDGLRTEVLSPSEMRDDYLTVLSVDEDRNGPPRPESLFNHLPLLAALPLRNDGYAIRPANCRVLPQPGRHHGRDCIVIEEVAEADAYVRMIYADPQAGFRILGSFTRYQDGTWDRISFGYTGLSADESVPATWSLVATRRDEETFHEYAGQERLLVHGTAELVARSDGAQTQPFKPPDRSIVRDTRDRSWTVQTAGRSPVRIKPGDAEHRLTPVSLRKSRDHEAVGWRLVLGCAVVFAGGSWLLRRARRNT